MRFRHKQNHMIDFLFPVALLFVFAFCALTVILLAANIYRSTAEHSSLNYTARTSLSYLNEKIHQNDTGGNISVGSFDGCDALIISQTYEDAAYETYIYCYEDELKELFLAEGTEADASDGTTILAVQDFRVEEVSDRLVRISCTDESGQEASSLIGIRSQ